MAHQRWSERTRHLRRHGRGVVVVVLLALGACDPTGNLHPGGSGDLGYIDPQLIGSWRNQHLIPGGSPGDYTRIITVWKFDSAATCLRDTKTLLLSEGIEREQLRRCTFVTDGRVLSLTYEGYTDTVNYTYGFPTFHADTLEIGGFLFARVP